MEGIVYHFSLRSPAVQNVVLHSLGSAQCRSHKPITVKYTDTFDKQCRSSEHAIRHTMELLQTQTDGQILLNVLSPCYNVDNEASFNYFHYIDAVIMILHLPQMDNPAVTLVVPLRHIMLLTSVFKLFPEAY